MHLSKFDCGKIVNLGQYWLPKPQLGECAGWAEVDARASDDQWKMSGHFRHP